MTLCYRGRLSVPSDPSVPATPDLRRICLVAWVLDGVAASDTTLESKHFIFKCKFQMGSVWKF